MKYNRHIRGYYRGRKESRRSYGDMYEPKMSPYVYSYKEGMFADPDMCAFTAKPKCKGAKKLGIRIACILREQGQWHRNH